MRLLPTEDQRAMAETVRAALGKECSAEVLRASWGTSPNPRVWQALAELGVFGLTVPEEFDGLGLDERDLVGVLTEIGRAAVPGPVVETIAGAYVLRAVEQQWAKRWLPDIASGDLVVSLGLGSEPYVPSADVAELLILQNGTELHAVPAGKTALVAQQSVDGNRRLFTLEWEPSPATVLVSGDAATDVIAGARDRLLLGTSAQLVGLSGQILDLAVAHVSTREQFGRPLGTFQAVQHRLADVAVAVDFAGPVVARAACSLAAGAPSAPRDVAMAKVFASKAGELAAYSGLQVHGAIGYTREHDLHLYGLRAWTLALAHGDARHHRARVAEFLLGDDEVERYP
jgi:alkylation response protein AidB-like acyl-CoA dehydrogenase